jgi:hypothetical protein
MSRGHPIWTFQKKLTRRLLLWSGLSLIIGVLIFALSPGLFWRGFASQYVLWGLGNAVNALAGIHAVNHKFGLLKPETTDTISVREAASRKKQLAFNAGLDVLFVFGGLYLALNQFADVWRGVGWGVVAQGGFLIIFDLVHIFLCPKR